MGIDVIDSYIPDPSGVPGNIQHARNANVAQIEGCVLGTIGTRHLPGRPADNVRIEFAGCFRVAGHEFIPAELSFWRKHRNSSPVVIMLQCMHKSGAKRRGDPPYFRVLAASWRS